MRYLSMERAMCHVNQENLEHEPGCIVHRLEIGHKEADGKIYCIIGDVRLDADYKYEDSDDLSYCLWFSVYFDKKYNHKEALQYFRNRIDSLGLSVNLTAEYVEDSLKHVWKQISVSGDNLDYQDVAQVLGIYVDAICNHPKDEDIYVTVRTYDREYLDFEDCRNIYTGQIFQEDIAREFEVKCKEFNGE